MIQFEIDEFKAEIRMHLRRAMNYVEDWLGDAVEWYEAQPLQVTSYQLSVAEDDMTGDSVRVAVRRMHKMFPRYEPWTMIALAASTSTLDNLV